MVVFVDRVIFLQCLEFLFLYRYLNLNTSIPGPTKYRSWVICTWCGAHPEFGGSSHGASHVLPILLILGDLCTCLVRKRFSTYP